MLWAYLVSWKRQRSLAVRHKNLSIRLSSQSLIFQTFVCYAFLNRLGPNSWVHTSEMTPVWDQLWSHFKIKTNVMRQPSLLTQASWLCKWKFCSGSESGLHQARFVMPWLSTLEQIKVLCQLNLIRLVNGLQSNPHGPNQGVPYQSFVPYFHN